jgi:hypothetical protein
MTQEIQFLLDKVFLPVIITSSLGKANELCKQRSVSSFTELFQKFSRNNSDLSPFREEADSGVSPFSLRNIPAIFCDEKTQTTPITENQIDTSLAEFVKTASQNFSYREFLDNFFSAHQKYLRCPEVATWLELYQLKFLSLINNSLHETFWQPVANLKIVTTLNADPVSLLKEHNISSDGYNYVDSETVTIYSLVHDASVGNDDFFLEKLNEIKTVFEKCYILKLNNSEQENRNADQFPTKNLQKQLSSSELSSVRHFLQDIVTKEVTPHIHKRIAELSFEVIANFKIS